MSIQKLSASLSIYLFLGMAVCASPSAYGDVGGDASNSSISKAEQKGETATWASEVVLLSGSANKELAQEISREIGVPVTDAGLDRFKNGEIFSKIKGTVRGKTVYILASFAEIEGRSINDYIIEFQIMCDAVMRAGAKSIVAVIPSFPYARQDRKSEGRAPISAAMMAKTLENVCRVDHVVTVDLHSDQIQGFFENTVVDNLTAARIFAEQIKRMDLKDIVVVSPDAGGVKRAERFKNYLLKDNNQEAGFALMIKKRIKAGEVDKITLVGDVKGKVAIIVDDMCDTGGTLAEAAKIAMDSGAKKVIACITHPILSGDAVSIISKSKFEKVFVTNSLPAREKYNDKIVKVSLSKLLGEVIVRIQKGSSVSEVF